MDHVRRAHKVPEEVQYIRLEMLFPPGVYRLADVATLQYLQRRFAVQRYRNYMSQLRALLPLPAVLPIEGGSPDPACLSVVESPDVVCASPRPSRRAFARRRPTRVMETPVRIAPHLTIQDPLAAAGAVVLDCRPQVLPGAMDVSGTDLAEIRSMSRAGVAVAVPPEREQSFGGGGGVGGGDLLSLICPELGVTPQVDTGTDLEDELSIPTSLPAHVNHEVMPLYMRADVDSELEQVFGDVGSLPTMVTPVCDLDGALHVTPAECPVIEPPGMSAFVTRPSMASSPAGPKFLSPGFSHHGCLVSASDVSGSARAGGVPVAQRC